MEGGMPLSLRLTYLVSIMILAGCPAQGFRPAAEGGVDQGGGGGDGKVVALDGGGAEGAVPDAPKQPDTQPWPDTAPTPDTQPWPNPDTQPWPVPDTKPWPTPDTKPWPTPDTKPWPVPDTKPWPTPDTKPWPGDVWPTPTSCASVLGKTCTKGSTVCGTAATCLLTSGNKGVCTCECFPPAPCPNSAQNACLSVSLSNGTTKDYCLKKCEPKLGSSDCPGKLACLPRSARFIGAKLQAVCMHYGCETNADCPVTTAKMCMTTGTPCPSGQFCIPEAANTIIGRCATPGVCDVNSGLCNAHKMGKATAKVGDPCTSDQQCGGSMNCIIETNTASYRSKWNAPCTSGSQCCSGKCVSSACTKGLCTVEARNGYCAVSGCGFATTLPLRSCPLGSACNLLYNGGMCQRSCTLTGATSCRGISADRYGDYECRAWNNLSIGVLPLASGPVCDFGPKMPCDFLQNSKLDCSYVGLSPNITQMACRGLNKQSMPFMYEPTGYCLDTTSSSNTMRSPLPTP